MASRSKYTRHWQKLAPAGLDLGGRVRWMLDNQFGHIGRFPKLEEETGISVRVWREVAYTKTPPPARVVLTLVMLKPELASWLETGVATGRGQLNPELSKLDPDNNQPDSQEMPDRLVACSEVSGWRLEILASGFWIDSFEWRMRRSPKGQLPPGPVVMGGAAYADAEAAKEGAMQAFREAKANGRLDHST